MTRARDVANVLSTATSLATDTETASAISSHNTAGNGHVSRGNTASRPASPTVGDFYSNTETGVLEIYESTGWTSVVPPSAPSSVVATNQGSGRAYNNGQASVAFSAGTFPGTTYTITSSPGSYTASGSTSPITITGLQSSTQYTYTAVASSKYGTSSASSASTGVTATTVPQAPTIDSVTAGDAQVSVAFTAGATGGSAITGYTVTSSPGSLTVSGASSPLVVTGLTNGTAYTFTAIATNANGNSLASSASSSVTPVVAGDFFFIQSVNPAGSNSFTFSSIPQTYKHLQLRGLLKDSDPTDNGSNTYIRFNGNEITKSYMFRSSGNAIQASTVSDGLGVVGYTSCSRASDTGIWGSFIIDIPDYSSTTKNKSYLSNFDQMATVNGDTLMGMATGTLNSNSALSSITLYNQSSRNWVSGSTMALYGIKGA